MGEMWVTNLGEPVGKMKCWVYTYIAHSFSLNLEWKNQDMTLKNRFIRRLEAISEVGWS